MVASSMYGADSDELDRLARTLRSAADELNGLMQQGAGSVSLATLGTTVHTLWRGPRASDFGAVWQSRHLLKLHGLQRMLNEAADTATQNANEQRQTSLASGLGPSNSGASSAFSGAARTEAVSEAIEADLFELEAFFAAFGVSAKVWEGIVKSLRIMNPDVLKSVGGMLARNPALLQTLKGLDKAVDVGAFLVDFVVDMSSKIDIGLPFDEAIVHALGEAGSIFLVGEVVQKSFAAVVSGVLTGATFGVGAAPAAAVGWIVGTGVEMIVDVVMDNHEVGEKAGDAALTVYRTGKEIAGVVNDVHDAVVDTAEAAVDVVVDAGEAVLDVGKAMISGSDDLVDDGFNMVRSIF